MRVITTSFLPLLIAAASIQAAVLNSPSANGIGVHFIKRGLQKAHDHQLGRDSTVSESTASVVENDAGSASATVATASGQSVDAAASDAVASQFASQATAVSNSAVQSATYHASAADIATNAAAATITDANASAIGDGIAALIEDIKSRVAEEKAEISAVSAAVSTSGDTANANDQVVQITDSAQASGSTAAEPTATSVQAMDTNAVLDTTAVAQATAAEADSVADVQSDAANATVAAGAQALGAEVAANLNAEEEKVAEGAAAQKAALDVLRQQLGLPSTSEATVQNAQAKVVGLDGLRAFAEQETPVADFRVRRMFRKPRV